jgi:hypothetical protein
MAAKANIIIEQGTDYSTTLTVETDTGSLQDLTGYTASAQMRKHYTSNTSTNFTVSFGSPRTNGQLTLALARNITESIADGRYVYDVEITNSANTRSRLVEGIVTVTPQVTR